MSDSSCTLVDPSVSQGVLHHTRRPVLVVHEEHSPGDPSSGHVATDSEPGADATPGGDGGAAG